MRQYIDLLSDIQGNAIFGATCTVTNYVGGALALIFSDNGLTPIVGSVVSTDITGQYAFFVADGDYTLTLKVNGQVYKTLSPVSIFDGAAQVTQADTGGAANVYGTSSNVLEKALRTGLRAWFQAAHTNTGASTFSYNGLTAKPIVAFDGSAVLSGVIVANGIYAMEYNGASWQLAASFLTASTIGSVLYPPSAAEISGGVTIVNQSLDYGDFRRFGIVPNAIGSAASNSTILNTLFNPAVTGPTGSFRFVNTTGQDSYYFANVHGLRPGISIDLMGCQLIDTFTGSTADNACGMFTVFRDFEIRNGTIVLAYTAGPGYPSGYNNNGNIFSLGQRGNQMGIIPTVYDALQVSNQYMGDFKFQNLRLFCTANTGSGRAFFGLGGIQGYNIDNCFVDGGSVMGAPGYHEFGYATNPTDPSSRQSSFPNKVRVSNFLFQNFVTTTAGSNAPGGFDGNGGYDIILDGIKGIGNCYALAQWGVGQAGFYRPWTGVDQAGAKHGFIIRNSTIDSCVSTGITVTGQNGNPAVGNCYAAQWTATTTYHGNGTANAGDVVFNSPNLYVLASNGGTSGSSGGPTGVGTGIVDGSCTWNYVPLSATTDLLDCLVQKCTIRNAGGYGVRLSGATQAEVHGCYITGCQRGVVTDEEATLYHIHDNIIRDCTSIGIEIGLGVSVYGSVKGTVRQSIGRINGNFIAGSTGAAIAMSATIQCEISYNRFGYEAIHDDDHATSGETTQTNCVNADTTCFGVTCHHNYVGGNSGGSNACFVLASAGSTSRGCYLDRNSFNAAILSSNWSSGAWVTDFQTTTALAIATNGTISTTGFKYLRCAPAAAVTGVILGQGVYQGQEVTVFNESVAADTITFAAAGTSFVADGVSSPIAGLTARKFTWDQGTSLWYRNG